MPRTGSIAQRILTRLGRRWPGRSVRGQACAWRFLLSGALMAIGISGCQMISASTAPELPISTAQVARGDMASVVFLAGQVAALEERALTFGTQGGRVLKVYVQPGQQVVAGQELVQLDTSASERQLREAQADLKVAEAALAAVQLTSGVAEIAAAEKALASAELALTQAEYGLAVARDAGIEPLEDAVKDAASALQQAQDALSMQETGMNQSTIRTLEYQQAFFQRKLRDLSAESEPEYKDAKNALGDVERQLAQARSERERALRDARHAVKVREDELAQAKERLGDGESGEDDLLASLKLSYEQALLSVEQARQRLEDLQSGVDSDAVQAAKTNLEAAQARVDGAQEAIDAATLRAPFGGVIFEVFVQVGSIVQASDTIAYLADPEALLVRAQATEADIAKLRVGQGIRITFDARPGVFYDGEIVTIPMRGEPGSGMSVYAVEASLLDPDGAIRPGLLANMHVLVGQKENVLTIPTAAIQYRPPQDSFVTLVDELGQTREVAVEIGMNDGILAEVISGLSEGDTVALPLVPPMDPRQQMGIVAPAEVIE